MAQILFFGASSVQGVGDSEGGWVERLKRELHQVMYGTEGTGEKHAIFNLGIAGNTAEMVLRRFKQETESRVRTGQEIIFVFAVGTNDSKATDSRDNQLFTVEQFQQNLVTLLDEAKTYSDKLILVGITPTDDAKTQPKGSSYFSQQRVKAFDQAATAASQSHTVPKVEIFDDFLAQDWKSLLYEDGLHPNAKGHALIAQKVQPYLWKMLGL